MPVRVIITKGIEAGLRSLLDDSPNLEAGQKAAREILGKMEAASKQRGLPCQVFLDVVGKYRRIVLPKYAGAEGDYKRLAATLRRLGVTEPNAHALGAYLRAQTKWQDVTLDSLTRNLPSWLARALDSGSPIPAIPSADKMWEDE